MDDIYLVEIRLGRTKWRIRNTVFTIARMFNIGNFVERNPHVTLFGPLTLKNGVTPVQLLDAIGQVAATCDPILFTIDGWERREGMSGSVIAFRVRPSEELKNLTTAIADAVSPFVCSSNIWDTVPGGKWFHVTVANRLEPPVASSLFSTLLRCRPDVPGDTMASGFFAWILYRIHHTIGRRIRDGVRPVTLDEAGLRITVMKGESILAEYDLLEKCWITSGHSQSNPAWQNTLRLYRHDAGFERLDPGFSDPRDIFLIADLHLGHANIIRYCSRPFFFSDICEMDHVLIKNWNYTISPANQVYYLGDLCYGPGAHSAEHYLNKLRGHISFIRGNHDLYQPEALPMKILEHGGLKFCLVHDPADAPERFEGWIIHGHHHNNNLRSYPFINFEDRRINVSAEVLGYVPVSLTSVCSLIEKRSGGTDRTPILLNYAYSWE
jgi:calcineurin-like phosphoesterase family protein